MVGTAIVVANGHGGVRRIAGNGSCTGCAWKIVPECAFHGSSAGKTDPNACNNATSGYVCTVSGKPGSPYRAFFSPAGLGGPWGNAGDVCLAPTDKPVSTDALFAQVRGYVDRLIPAAPAVAMQPAGGVTLVAFPTLFQTGQPTEAGNQPAGKVFFAHAGAAIAIDVRVQPQQWVWSFDAGAGTLSRGFCCRRYDPAHDPKTEPGYYAGYTFDALGAHTATVTVTWTATMTITGLGTVPVQGSFTRSSAPYPFQVKEARARLESNG